MNRRIIIYILGWILMLEGAFMALPCIVSLCYQEVSGWWFFIVMMGSILLGLLISFKKPKNTVFYIKEGCVATALSWILLSVVGCLPFFLSGSIPDFTDALFETISGFTTTGASVLSDVEALPYCMLFWRSFTHWLGGMGVLVFLLAVIQMSGGSHMNLMKAESPGPSVGKLGPKVMYTARILYLIYIGLTVIHMGFLLAGGMPFFDTMTTAFGSAGTGGFGIKNDSIASYSPYIQWVVTVFMAIFGVNFNFYFLLLFRKWKQALRMEEVISYFAVIVAAVLLVTWNILSTAGNFGENLRQAAFQVTSIITTTGYSTINFDLWPSTSRTILVILMFVGACAGSTGGGIKVSRFVILIKTVGRQLKLFIHPKSVNKIKMDGKPVEAETVRGTSVYFITFIAIFVGSVICISFEGKDLLTNFTAVAATFNNIGPGLELVGPTQNFGIFSVFSKYILMFDMLAGRLELFPLLILFYPPAWKGIFRKRYRLPNRTNG